MNFGGHPELLARVGATWRFRAQGSGHTVLTVGKGRTRRQIYLFVSPLPSHQVTRDDVDWYKTQWGTGYANCGPAVVSMAILWSRGQDIPVQSIREEIGYPYDDGAVSFDNLRDALGRHRIPFTVPQLVSPADLRSIVDRGHIAVVLIQSGVIEKVRGDPVTDLSGRYYDDDEGHYVLVKGYTLDKGYLRRLRPVPRGLGVQQHALHGRREHDRQEPLLLRAAAFQRAEDPARPRSHHRTDHGWRGPGKLTAVDRYSTSAQTRTTLHPDVTERMLASGVASTENAPLIAHAQGMSESVETRRVRGAQGKRPSEGDGQRRHEEHGNQDPHRERQADAGAHERVKPEEKEDKADGDDDKPAHESPPAVSLEA